eukprot:6225288-Amphidinium_carterae.1
MPAQGRDEKILRIPVTGWPLSENALNLPLRRLPPTARKHCVVVLWLADCTGLCQCQSLCMLVFGAVFVWDSEGHRHQGGLRTFCFTGHRSLSSTTLSTTLLPGTKIDNEDTMCDEGSEINRARKCLQLED